MKLVHEFLWFQRYINDHDLEIQMEIEDDKIVFLTGEKLIEWGVAEARRIRTEVMIDADQSYWYAKNVINGRFEFGELVISTSGHYSCRYAKEVIKKRFEMGEFEIAKNINDSYLYKRFLSYTRVNSAMNSKMLVKSKLKKPTKLVD